MKLNHAFGILFVIVFFTSCNDDGSNPISVLEPIPVLPAEAVNHFTIISSDTTIRLTPEIEVPNFDSAGLYYSSQTLIGPAEGVQAPVIVGATIHNSLDLEQYHIRYSYTAETQTELIQKLRRPDHDFRRDLPENRFALLQEEGFAFGVDFYQTPMGVSNGFSSAQQVQPTTSYFRIVNVYKDGGANTGALNRLWLEGEYQVIVPIGGRETSYTGSFLMDFPVCCF